MGEVISVWPGPAQVDEGTLLMIFDHNGVVALATHAWLKISQEKDERLYKAWVWPNEIVLNDRQISLLLLFFSFFFLFFEHKP